MFKDIYSFKIQVKREVEEIEIKTEKDEQGNEQEIEVKKKVKKKVPIEIAVKQPTRKEIEDAETEYAIKMSECIKKGILTKAMLAKKYSDTGGALSEEDAKKMLNLYKDIADIEKEIARMSINGFDRSKKSTKDKIKDFEERLLAKRREIFDLENDYQALFSHTADVKARNHTMLWYIINLSYYKSEDLEIKEYKRLFEGDNFEKRLENFYEKEEGGDDIYNLAGGKIASIISYWYFSGGEISKENIKELIEEHS
jgi:hypothetical protein